MEEEQGTATTTQGLAIKQDWHSQRLKARRKRKSNVLDVARRATSSGHAEQLEKKRKERFLKKMSDASRMFGCPRQ